MPTPVVYPNFLLKQNNGVRNIDLDGAAIKMAFLTSAYVPASTDDVFTDISANEVSGTGYTAGGAALTGKTYVLDGNNAEFAHDDVTVAQNAAGFSNGRTAVWYDSTTGGLIMRLTDGSDFGNVAGDLTIDGDVATGVLQFQA